MITRSLSKTVAFSKPFQLKGIDRVLPAGDYRVVPVYRRVATMMFVPAQSCPSVEMVTIDPLELQAAQNRDAKAC
jgi:hypothetical protein